MCVCVCVCVLCVCVCVCAIVKHNGLTPCVEDGRYRNRHIIDIIIMISSLYI